jgi:predicted DsbA family dithiol-disulfide isomerase
MHAAQLIGRPIDHLLWMKDPPSSSYPAGVAVKCAHLQSAELGVAYFKCVQRSAMLNSKNVAKQQVLEEIAAELAAENPSFSLEQFMADYQQGNGIIGFREDLALVARYRVTRFPTLILEVEKEKGIVISGYRTSEQIMAAIDQAFPGFQ